MSFKDLGLSDLTLKAIEELGYKEPTLIQAQAIPTVLRGGDVVGIAQTGTGKTGGFVLPMLDILSCGKAKARMPRSLILAPTRELAMQIGENFVQYGKYHRLSMALLIGGESVAEQQKLLSHGVDVLIATPGRMIDLFERGQIIMTGIKIIVIDEADRMLDMGFIPDVKKIISWTGRMRQTLLFSATMDKEIKKIAEEFMSMPKEIFVTNPSSAAKTVSHFVVYTAVSEKKKLLCDLIDSENIKNAMIFCNRKKDVAAICNMLKSNRYEAGCLHGDMQQMVRSETIEAFKNDEFKFLVCSDVAARGLDLPDVSHVFLFDVPYKSEDYVHRIGRTGRAGKEGKAFTLVTDEDFKALDAVEEVLGKPIPLSSDFGYPEEFEIRRAIARKHKYKVEGNPNKRRQTPLQGKQPVHKQKPPKSSKPQEYADLTDNNINGFNDVEGGRNKGRGKDQGNDKELREANPYMSPRRPDGGLDSRYEGRSGTGNKNNGRNNGKHNSQNQRKQNDEKAFGDHMPAFFGVKI